MITTLIIPGLDGSAEPHWQHWWAATDPSALMVDLPNPHLPQREAWEDELAGMILRHPGSLLVGHSLGAVLIAGLLAKWPQLPARAALLVAPAETRGAARISHFGAVSERALPVAAKVVFSRNDPWMAAGRAVELATAWKANTVDMGNVGHINVASGHGPWPLGKRLARELHDSVEQTPAPVWQAAVQRAAPARNARRPAWALANPYRVPLLG